MWTPHAEYSALGLNTTLRQEVYREHFKEEPGVHILKDIRLSVNTGFVFGSDVFRKQLERESGYRQSFLKRGRPSNTIDM